MIRKLKSHFHPSELFKPWLDMEHARRRRESSFQRRRRRMQQVELKIGHGGTLDPLATGVLVTGIGRGTKQLHGFLECTKTYEAVVLFGAETDTYDRLGKIVRRGPYAHVTREAVERALEQFRGPIMQYPPIFSALKVQGKKLYEYAREGKEPPIEIQARPVQVLNMEILEWYEPGTHDFKWPDEEMGGEEKQVAEKILAKDDSLQPVVEPETKADAAPATQEQQQQQQQLEPLLLKRKASASPLASDMDTPAVDNARSSADNAPGASPSLKRQKPNVGSVASQTAQPSLDDDKDFGSSGANATDSAEVPNRALSPSGPPAVKLTMTVTSGFYVRSLAHDLGKALKSCGLMSSLVRTRQADFHLVPDKVLEYRDLDAGEEVWAPKVKRFLEEWEEKTAAKAEPEPAEPEHT